MAAGSGTEFGRLLTTPGPLWPFLLLLSSHTRLSPKSFQQLRQRTGFHSSSKEGENNQAAGRSSLALEANPSHNSENAELLPPAATQTSLPWHHGSSCAQSLGWERLIGAGWCPPPQRQAQPVSTTSTALVPVWNWLHVLLWSQRRAQETPTRAKERCPQSVCAFRTPELWCIWQVRPSRCLPGESQPQQLKSQSFTRLLLHGERSW